MDTFYNDRIAGREIPTNDRIAGGKIPTLGAWPVYPP